MTILTYSGHRAVMTMLKNATLYIAWGSGDPAWDTTETPTPTGEETALRAEIGRRRVTHCDFVAFDYAGDIALPQGRRYSLSAEATSSLCLRVTFDATDAPTSTLRELGVYYGTVPASGHEADAYLDPEHLEDPGILLALEHLPAVRRSTPRQEQFTLILSLPPLYYQNVLDLAVHDKTEIGGALADNDELLVYEPARETHYKVRLSRLHRYVWADAQRFLENTPTRHSPRPLSSDAAFTLLMRLNLLLSA